MTSEEIPGFDVLAWYGTRAGLIVSINYRFFWALDVFRAGRHIHICLGPLEVSAWVAP